MIEKETTPSAVGHADIPVRCEVQIIDIKSSPAGIRELLAGTDATILKGESNNDRVAAFAHSTAAGLSARPRYLDCRYLYDARGSALFDLITEQPEYYLTRTESQILAGGAGQIRNITGPATIVELGSGSATKTDYLLRAWLAADSLVRYIPVDVSESALRSACDGICSSHAGARVAGICADYREAFPIFRQASPTVVLFLGSTIGNFNPEQMSAFTADLASSLSPGDFFLIGVDLVKDAEIIEPAYNDAAGVTAEFTRNLFARMNRELDSHIDLSSVEHIARYNFASDQVDIFARFNRDQIINVDGESFTIEAGEMIQTEISRKFRLREFIPYVEGFGFEAEEVLTDKDDWFALVLFRRNGECEPAGWV